MQFQSYIHRVLLFTYRVIVGIVRKPYQYVRGKMNYAGIVRYNYSVNIVKGSTFEGANSIADNSYFSGHMGYGTYLMQNTYLIGTVGRFSSVGAYFMNVQGVHPFETPFATTSPMFYSLKRQSTYTFADRQMFDEMRDPIIIGNDCWIGPHVFANGGLTIGDGAVVLGGAVLTKDVPPYAIVGGVPARILRYRYDDDTIQFLLATRWWEKPIPWLKENWEAFCDIEKLKILLSD